MCTLYRCVMVELVLLSGDERRPMYVSVGFFILLELFTPKGGFIY